MKILNLNILRPLLDLIAQFLKKAGAKNFKIRGLKKGILEAYSRIAGSDEEQILPQE